MPPGRPRRGKRPARTQTVRRRANLRNRAPNLDFLGGHGDAWVRRNESLGEECDWPESVRRARAGSRGPPGIARSNSECVAYRQKQNRKERGSRAAGETFSLTIRSFGGLAGEEISPEIVDRRVRKCSMPRRDRGDKNVSFSRHKKVSDRES